MAIQKELAYAKATHNYELKKTVLKKRKKLMNKIHTEVKRREDEKLKEKLKKEFLELKKKKKMEHKVVINNHVDSKYFDFNFTGIRDMFIKFFGT